MYIACHILRLGTEARFSALVFLHRFAMAHDANDNGTDNDNDNDTDDIEWNWVAAACLFLACKAEEEPRRLRDVINLAHMILTSTSTAPAAPDDDDKDDHDKYGTEITLHPEPPHLNEAYWVAKKKIVETEQVVLRWLGFDVSVSHPHRAVALLLKDMDNKETTQAQKDKVMLIAFRRLNDALFHGPALQHLALELACAAIELAKDEHEHEYEAVVKVDDEVTITAAAAPEGWWKRYNVSDAGLSKTKQDLQTATNLLKEFSEQQAKPSSS
jgi:hypothetical protein